MTQALEAYPWKKLAQTSTLIGVDEVGRGCLAGPVYAAAAILDNSKDNIEQFIDSKSLSEKRRETLSEIIQSEHKVCLGFATVNEITELNILNASLLAMKRAVEKLGVDHGHILVDGKFTIPGLNNNFKQSAVIKGDFRVPCIGAASIVAKVARDNLLKQMAEEYPNYGFEKHKAYATKAHKQAIEKFGPCPEHRPSFAGVKEHL